jgi:hypothetical protein
MPTPTVHFRHLLHAANLRHGTHGFTSLPKDGVLRIFPSLKIRRLRPGLNTRTLVPEASTLTPRPPKPLLLCLSLYLPDDGLLLAETGRRVLNGKRLYIINCAVCLIRQCIIFRCTVLIGSARQRKVQAVYCQTKRHHIYIIEKL